MRAAVLATPLLRALLGAIGKHCNLQAISPMPPPYPVQLFTGQRIIDEAHQITGKVVDRISHATLASLTAKPVDDIVQALYNEYYIHLPVLDRNGAEHEEFEFFYAPYLAMM